MNLSERPPRRWSERVDGICWLPRMIDKARAYDAGTLGTYFFGQSPVDAGLLRSAALRYADILEASRLAPDDAGVLAELERRSPGATQRMRAWAARPGTIAAFTFKLIDIDEGYATGFFPSLVRSLPLDRIAAVVGALLPRSRIS